MYNTTKVDEPNVGDVNLPAAEYNALTAEIKNTVTSAGMSLSNTIADSDTNQLAKAISVYASGGDFYTDSGTVNNYVLNIVGNKKAPPAYFDGMKIRFLASNASTGASTVNIDSLGVKNIKKKDGTDILSNDIKLNQIVELYYNNNTGYFVFTGEHDERYYTEVEIDDIVNTLFPVFGKPLAIISGNTDSATGYADIIHKESDTEVSFKVGGIYKSLVITGKDCKKYEISSIANVTLPTDAGTYIFIIDFTNITNNGDGTYSAIATAVKTGYTSIENITQSVTLISGGDSVDPAGNGAISCIREGNPYPYWGSSQAGTDLIGNAYFGASNIPAGSKVSLIEFQNWISTGSGQISSVKVQYKEGTGSWTDIQTYSLDYSAGAWNSLIIPDYSVTGLHQIRVLANSSPITAYDHWLVAEMRMWVKTSYSGGNITEGYTLPSNSVAGDLHILINQIPYSPKKCLVDGIWSTDDREYVKIGEANRAINAGVLGIPRSYVFNRKTYKKISCPATNTYTDIVHDLGTNNIKITANLICLTGELGYTTGQKAQFLVYSSDRNMVPFAIKDKNTICLVNGNGNLLVPSLVTGYYVQITPANWNIEITVEANW